MRNRARFIENEFMLMGLDSLKLYSEWLSANFYDFGLVNGGCYKYLGFFMNAGGLMFIYVADDGLVSRYPVVVFDLAESNKILCCKKSCGGIDFIPDRLIRHHNWFERYLDEDDEVVADVNFLIDLDD